MLSCFSCIGLFATIWTIPCQALLSVVFSRQEYWNGLPFPSLGALSDYKIKYASLALASRFFTAEPPGSPNIYIHIYIKKNVYICSCLLGFTFHTSRSGLIELVYVLIIPWIFLSRTHLSARPEFHEGKGLYLIYLCTHTDCAWPIGNVQ